MAVVSIFSAANSQQRKQASEVYFSERQAISFELLILSKQSRTQIYYNNVHIKQRKAAHPPK